MSELEDLQIWPRAVPSTRSALDDLNSNLSSTTAFASVDAQWPTAFPRRREVNGRRV